MCLDVSCSDSSSNKVDKIDHERNNALVGIDHRGQIRQWLLHN